jgi:WD40 repeat protein
VTISKDDPQVRARASHVVVVFSSWPGEPAQALSAAIGQVVAAELDSGGEPLMGDSLVETLERCSELYDGEVLVILDQFEEFFVYHPDARPEDAFPSELARAIRDPNLRANFLVSIRDDALARLHLFKGLIPGLFENRLQLDRLTREAGRDAILMPLERYNELVPEAERVSPEPLLVEAVLDEVTAGRVRTSQIGVGSVAAAAPERRIEAPYLQLVMERLWNAERERGSRTLRRETLEELGGAQEIVRGYLHGELRRLAPDQRKTAAEIFSHLVTPSGTKIAHTAEDLAALSGGKVREIEPMLQQLEGARILRQEGSRYEIFHDVLAGAVLQWRSEYEAEQRIERERRRRRRLVAGIVGLLGVVIAVAALAVFSVLQWREASKQRTAAEVRQLSLVADSQLTVDPQVSLQLALEAFTKAPSDDEGSTRGAVLRALSESRESNVRAVLRGHTSPVWTAAFSPNSKLVVTASDDWTARVWDAESGEELAVLEHDSWVGDASFSPDSRRIVTATGAGDDTARVWDAESGEQLAELEHPKTVREAAFSPDGRWIATANDDGVARVWDWRREKTIAVLKGHGDRVREVAFSPDGAQVATASDDGTARVWDWRSGDEFVLRGHSGRVYEVAFDASGMRVVTAGDDGTARVWDWRTEEATAVLRGHKGTVFDAAFAPTGTSVVTASGDGTARIWGVDGTPLAILRGHQGSVRAAAFSPDGSRIVTASDDGTARIWRPQGGPAVAVLRGHEGAINDVAVSPDGEGLVTASDDRTARLWQARSEPVLAVLRGHEGAVRVSLFNPDGARVVTASDDGTARVWNWRRERADAVLRGHEGALNDAAVMADGSVVTAGDDGTARVWPLQGGPAVVLDGHAGAINDVALSSDGRRIVTASDDGTARVWDPRGATVAVLRGDDGPLLSASFNPAGTRVVTGSDDGTALVWDASSGRELFANDNFENSVVKVAFSPNGAWVLAAAQDDVQLWQPAEDRSIALQHEGFVVDAAFNADGRRVVTASWVNASIWNAENGHELAVLRGHEGILLSAVYSPDGKRVVTTSWDGTARIWDPESGEEIAVLRGHTGAVLGAAFSPDGRRLVTAGEDGTARVFACEACGSEEQLLDMARSRIVDPLTPEDRSRLGVG